MANEQNSDSQVNNNGYANGEESNARSRSRRRRDDDEFTFEIRESYGVLSVALNGWLKEFNLVSWNGTRPKYDLREWSPDHSHMTRGITLNKEEAAKLKEAIATAV